MRVSVLREMSVLVLAVVGIASRSNADPLIIVPAGLAPGSPYRLAFVTAETYTADSFNIDDYNNNVNSEANGVAALAALGATWFDIGSTPTVDAIDNIGIDSGVPIYDLAGNLIANDAGTEAGGMFSGTISGPIGTNELGVSPTGSPAVWTGTNGNTGTAFSPFELGASGGTVVYGVLGATDVEWIAAGIGPSDFPLSLYGISGILTATPEPSSMGTVIGGAALLCIARRRYRRATRTNP